MTDIISNILVSLANILVMVSLIPSIRSNQKPHINTCLMNVLVSIIFVMAFFIIELWIVVMWNALIGIVWGYLTYQVYKISKKPKDQKIDPSIIKMDDEIDMLDGYAD